MHRQPSWGHAARLSGIWYSVSRHQGDVLFVETTTMSLGFRLFASEVYAIAIAVGPKFAGETSSVKSLILWTWMGGMSYGQRTSACG